MLIFVAGTVLGAAGYRAWVDAMHALDRRAWAAEQAELLAEIKRQRAQIADMVGK